MMSSSQGGRVDPVTLAEFQSIIDRTYGEKDEARGLAGTFMWFIEEVGELARALKRADSDLENLRVEFADVLAWLTTLASLAGIDLADAAARYTRGCPRCGAVPCECGERTRFHARAGIGI